ncbi:hypothetical protein [Microseira wollei]|uniref:hypothetical protein n=1 Tax=Microseira wollei TaxID=467598 RepID=UPI001CFD5B7E|nr:hypothetical protein [Microseira wollei]
MFLATVSTLNLDFAFVVKVRRGINSPSHSESRLKPTGKPQKLRFLPPSPF